MADHIEIGDITPWIQYTADGATDDFDYPFPIFANADLKVYVDGTLQTITTHYTVTGAGTDDGGTVTFVSTPADESVITLLREITIERTSDFQNSGEFRAKVINDDLDKLTAMLQQLQNRINRSVRLIDTDTAATLTLPNATNRASKAVTFDASGNVSVTAFADLGAGTVISTDTPEAPTTAGTAGTSTDVSAKDHAHPLPAVASGLTRTGDQIAPDIASQAEAEAGTATGKLMTPQRVSQAITALASGADSVARDMAASALAYAMAQNDASSITGAVGRFYLSDDFESDSLATSTNATYDSSGDYYHNGGSGTQIAQGDGTPIGGMTGGGGLSAGYDGNNNQAAVACATEASVTVARIGKDYGSGTERVVTGMKTWGANDDGYSSSNPTIDLVLKASNTDPTGTGWTGDTIGTIAQFSDGATALPKETLDNANATAYRYVWCEITGGSSSTLNMAEVEFYEAATPDNMTLAPTAATLDTADPSDILAYIVIDPQESITAGTDIVMTMSIDGGSTDATGSWTKVGDIGAAGEELWRVEADVSAQTGSSLTYEITTANNKEIRYHDCVGLVAIY